MSSHITVFFTVPPKDIALDKDLNVFLSLCEIERAEKYRFAKDRAAFVVGRALLKYAVEVVAGDSNYVLEINPLGKPLLKFCDGRPALHFSLSHTEGLVVCAISPSVPVGVDVERKDRQVDYTALGSLCLSDLENQKIQTLPHHRQSEYFMRIWVVKEAIVKALGLGLSLPLPQLTIKFDPLSVLCSPSLHLESEAWSVIERVLMDDYRVALMALPTDRKTVLQKIEWRRIVLKKI